MGDDAEPEFSILLWYVRLQQFHGERQDRSACMFTIDDLSTPLLYREALEQWYTLQRRVGVPETELTGLHGLRVLGYDATRQELGADVAQAHGLWFSEVHNRYARFQAAVIASIPRAIARSDAPVVPEAPAPAAAPDGEDQ